MPDGSDATCSWFCRCGCVFRLFIVRHINWFHIKRQSKYVQSLLFTFYVLKTFTKCLEEVCTLTSIFRCHSRFCFLENAQFLSSCSSHSFNFILSNFTFDSRALRRWLTLTSSMNLEPEHLLHVQAQNRNLFKTIDEKQRACNITNVVGLINKLHQELLCAYLLQ